MWIISNTFIVALVLLYDPTLVTYVSVVTGTVIFQVRPYAKVTLSCTSMLPQHPFALHVY